MSLRDFSGSASKENIREGIARLGKALLKSLWWQKCSLAIKNLAKTIGCHIYFNASPTLYLFSILSYLMNRELGVVTAITNPFVRG
jgi:hypothetical protein